MDKSIKLSIIGRVRSKQRTLWLGGFYLACLFVLIRIAPTIHPTGVVFLSGIAPVWVSANQHTQPSLFQQFPAQPPALLARAYTEQISGEWRVLARQVARRPHLAIGAEPSIINSGGAGNQPNQENNIPWLLDFDSSDPGETFLTADGAGLLPSERNLLITRIVALGSLALLLIVGFGLVARRAR